MTELWSFDFGESSGISVGRYDFATPYTPIGSWQVPGGLEGLAIWAEQHRSRVESTIWRHAVVEKFVVPPGGHAGNLDIAGVPLEGVVPTLFPWNSITWHTRADKGRKGIMDAILKESGLWVSADETEWEDARDVNDTLIQALVYLRNRNHLPTLRRYFGGGGPETGGSE